MIFKKSLKNTESYISHQKELESYRKLGLTEYVFKGAGCCDACKALDGKSFRVADAKVGVNFPPMRLDCKCTIVAKPKINLFEDRSNENPLKSNPKFEEWIKKQNNTI